MCFLRELDVLYANSSSTKAGGKTYTDEKWCDCDLARSIAVDWHSSTRLEIRLQYLHPAPAQTRSAMATSSQGCFIVKTLLYGNSFGKTWTWQCFIIRCYFSWIFFAFGCMRQKSLKPNYCCKYWLLSHTGESQAPQNSNLEKGKGRVLDEEILWNQGKEEVPSEQRYSQLRRKMS